MRANISNINCNPIIHQVSKINVDFYKGGQWQTIHLTIQV